MLQLEFAFSQLSLCVEEDPARGEAVFAKLPVRVTMCVCASQHARKSKCDIFLLIDRGLEWQLGKSHSQFVSVFTLIRSFTWLMLWYLMCEPHVELCLWL